MTTTPILRPFFYFYGGKWRASTKYPPPQHQRLIEPFAGGAGYSQRYHWLDIHLSDVDPIVCGLWQYLIGVSESEIRGLPLDIDHVDNLSVCQEAKWLIGFWLNKGTSSPRKSPSAWMRTGYRSPNSFWGGAVREMIASQLPAIRHWKVQQASYEDVPDSCATWFIDPPYSDACGKQYRFNTIDYHQLSSWCQGRSGQVIACEKVGADWLPFEPLLVIQSSTGRASKEAVWLKQ